jgi:hypothetical protein
MISAEESLRLAIKTVLVIFLVVVDWILDFSDTAIYSEEQHQVALLLATFLAVLCLFEVVELV